MWQYRAADIKIGDIVNCLFLKIIRGLAAFYEDKGWIWINDNLEGKFKSWVSNFLFCKKIVYYFTIHCKILLFFLGYNINVRANKNDKRRWLKKKYFIYVIKK